MKKYSLLLLLCSCLSLPAQPIGKFGGGAEDGYGRATVSGGFVLPLEWTEINVQQAGPDAHLYWSTADEVNTQSFEVQRSGDGHGFETLSRLPAAGQGSNSYTYRDEGLALQTQGTVYYRVRQIDQDGRFSYSPIVALAVGPTPQLEVSLSPNPASDHLQVVVQAADSPAVLVRCFSMNGQLHYQSQIPTGGETQISVRDWAAGIYLWEVADGTHRFRKTILIQH